MNNPTLGTILREARKRAGLTQTEASELSGVPQSCISGYETGSQEPSVSFLQRLAVAYKVKLSKLVKPLDEVSSNRIVASACEAVAGSSTHSR